MVSEGDNLPSDQQVDPGGHVCSGFFSLLGLAVLPVTSLAAGRWAGAAVFCDVDCGAQLAPTGHVASGFCSFAGLGAAVCASAAPVANTAAAMMLRRSLGISLSIRTSPEVHVLATGLQYVCSSRAASKRQRGCGDASPAKVSFRPHRVDGISTSPH